MQIANEKVVTIDYTLTDEEGSVIDSSSGREPLAYLHGHGNLISGLEEALEGRSEGDTLQVQVAPEKAYGERDESLVQQVPKDRFDTAGGTPEVGMQFHAQTPNGALVVTVVEVADEVVTVDGNHPLAGNTLNFDVTVKGVRDASEEELAHGHVHGAGGHENE